MVSHNRPSCSSVGLCPAIKSQSHALELSAGRGTTCMTYIIHDCTWRRHLQCIGTVSDVACALSARRCYRLSTRMIPIIIPSLDGHDSYTASTGMAPESCLEVFERKNERFTTGCEFPPIIEKLRDALHATPRSSKYSYTWSTLMSWSDKKLGITYRCGKKMSLVVWKAVNQRPRKSF